MELQADYSIARIILQAFSLQYFMLFAFYFTRASASFIG